MKKERGSFTATSFQHTKTYIYENIDFLVLAVNIFYLKFYIYILLFIFFIINAAKLRCLS
jgi:hypothetical protein